MGFALAITYVTVFEIIVGLVLLPLYYFTEDMGIALGGLMMFSFCGLANAVLVPILGVLWWMNREKPGSARDFGRGIGILLLSFPIGLACAIAGNKMTSECKVTFTNGMDVPIEDVQVVVTDYEGTRVAVELGHMSSGDTRKFSLRSIGEGYANLKYSAGGRKANDTLIGYLDGDMCGKYEAKVGTDGVLNVQMIRK
ncbi:MAG: hypothetical protein ABL958_00070 [Bdellovibrionia bacterium]